MPQNPNDGTTLGTAEVISDEYIDPNIGLVRRDANLPATAYKLPRSKIAVGDYGQDEGDASRSKPLNTESYIERRQAELVELRGRSFVLAQKSAFETVPTMDSRGHEFSTRGAR